MNDNFIRLKSLLTDEQIDKISKARVCVCGLGGVGATACLTLARCGIKNFVICDFDKVDNSNINRQVISNIHNIGEYKVDVCEKMLLEINDECNIIKVKEKFTVNSNLFSLPFDYLIDAIDDVNNKVLLIKGAIDNNITFISSMGTGKKFDLTKLKIAKLNQTTTDPLAKAVRRKIKELNISNKFDCLYSDEMPKSSDILGSYMPVTSTAGLMLCDYIFKKIIN